MTPAEADWVAEHVLTRWALSGHKLADLRMCACQWGPTGHCEHGDHSKCSHHGRVAGWPRVTPETHVIDRHGGAKTAVWRVGTPCVWHCPCEVCAAAPALPGLELAGERTHRQGLEVPGRRLPSPDEQLSLFDLAGAA